VVATIVLSLVLGSDFVGALILGLAFGSVFALLALGLVLTYRTTGVFNLAFGPLAFFIAAVYYDTHITHHWPMYLALVWSVLIVAPLTGLAFDRLLFRYLRSASETAKLVSVLGLFVAVPQIVYLWFGFQSKSGAVGIVPHGDVAYSPIHNVFVSRDDIALIVSAFLVFLGLTLVLRYTAIGLRMRAVVESARLTELAGVNADRVSMTSWMLASTLAGLAGVLLTPKFAGQVTYPYYEQLVIAAIAAAVLAGLTNIPLAYAGGLALGVLQQLLSRYLPTNNLFATTLKPALPFVVGFAVLVISPVVAKRRAVTDPLAGVDPPPPAPASMNRSAALTNATRIAAVVFFVVAGIYVFGHSSDYVLDLTEQTVILTVIFLSITVITGFAGQVSLCQAAFAAVGGAATAQFAANAGMSVLLAMVLGAAVAGLMGAVLAIPLLRLGGIFFSLATLAFAFFFDTVILQLGWVGGGTAAVTVPRPTLLGIDFSHSNKNFLALTLVVFVITSLVVIWVRNGTTGRYLDAMRGSEVAAASIGINRNRARIVAFALSAAIAGLGGGLFVMYYQSGNSTSLQTTFIPEYGLVWIVLVVTLGPRTVEGAINAAIGYVFFQNIVLPTWLPWIFNNVQLWLNRTIHLTAPWANGYHEWYHLHGLPAGLVPIFFGIGAFTYAKHPEGILEFQKRRSLGRVQKGIDRFSKGGKDGTTGTAAEVPVSPADAPVAAAGGNA
jgi:branched-subunit amino acid ABC-type transport system permease component